MHKTTLYLPKRDVGRLKALGLRSTRHGLTHYIRCAIREYLQRRRATEKRLTEWMRCKGMSRRRSWGDPVAYQRRLRGEWE